jgi:hypothetical protein
MQLFSWIGIEDIFEAKIYAESAPSLQSCIEVVFSALEAGLADYSSTLVASNFGNKPRTSLNREEFGQLGSFYLALTGLGRKWGEGVVEEEHVVFILRSIFSVALNELTENKVDSVLEEIAKDGSKFPLDTGSMSLKEHIQFDRRAELEKSVNLLYDSAEAGIERFIDLDDSGYCNIHGAYIGSIRDQEGCPVCAYRRKL